MSTTLARHFPALKRYLNKRVDAFERWVVRN